MDGKEHIIGKAAYIGSTHRVIDGDDLLLKVRLCLPSKGEDGNCVLCGEMLWGMESYLLWVATHEPLPWVGRFCGPTCREVWVATNLKEVAP